MTLIQSCKRTVVFNIDFWTTELQICIIKLYTNEFLSRLGNVMSEWLILVLYVAIFIFYS
jgi:hypothetical protein